MIGATTLGPSDDDGQLKVYDKYTKADRPYYVILDLFDTVHPVFNCDLARIIILYVPDLRKTPRIYTPSCTYVSESIVVNGITEDQYIELPTLSDSFAGRRLDIYVNSITTFNVHIRCSDSKYAIILGGRRCKTVSTAADNEHIRIITFSGNTWMVYSSTNHWSGEVFEEVSPAGIVHTVRVVHMM